MKAWITLIATLVALASARRDAAPTVAAGDNAGDSDLALQGELEQTESIFAFEVAERAADRATDDLRALDINVNGLLAVQAAIYAILIDRLNDFPPLVRLALIAAIVLSAMNLLLGRGKNVPRPIEFNAALRANVSRARTSIIDVLLERSTENDTLLERKKAMFRLALAVTLLAAIVAPVVPSGKPVLVPTPTARAAGTGRPIAVK